jgi:hypothetical protein
MLPCDQKGKDFISGFATIANVTNTLGSHPLHPLLVKGEKRGAVFSS